MDTLNAGPMPTPTRTPRPDSTPDFRREPGIGGATGECHSARGRVGPSERATLPHHRAPAALGPYWRPVAYGVLAALALLAFYLGIITLAQGWAHAVAQLLEDRWFVGAISAGFGTQLGLFTYLQSLHARAASAGAVTTTATSTATSAAAMLACCAHHVTDILPIVGLSGAAIFLDAYKTPLLWLGIAMNLFGIAYLLRRIAQARADHGYPVSSNEAVR
jgi:hypothetical protein